MTYETKSYKSGESDTKSEYQKYKLVLEKTLKKKLKHPKLLNVI